MIKDLVFSNVICPYCIRSLKDFAFRCDSCGKSVTPGRAALARFKLNGTLPRCDNPSCGQQTLTVCCPYGADSGETVDPCGQPLPSDLLQYRNYLRFSILGTSGAGKSNYLTMMIQQLKSSSGDGNPRNLCIEHVDSYTLATFSNHRDTILKLNIPVEPTLPGERARPQHWRIRQEDSPAASLTIFDGAGEDQERPEGRIVRYILGSKQFILLVDPLSIPSLRNRLTREQIMGASHETDPDAPAILHNGADMVVEIANFIRKNKGWNVDKKIDNPTAVVFTKLDLFLPQFENATVARESPHLAAGCFLEADSREVDREIRTWLLDNGGTGVFNDGADFVRAVERHFKNARFFGVSSFGVSPTENKFIRDVRPHRVLDPLMWLLAQENIIETMEP